jgi:hypothetical protein
MHKAVIMMKLKNVLIVVSDLERSGHFFKKRNHPAKCEVSENTAFYWVVL